MSRAAVAIALVAVAGADLACARRWAHDESARIDEAMAPERWSPSLPGARGIAVQDAPPLAPPWREGEGYELRRTSHGSRRLRSNDRKTHRADRSPAAERSTSKHRARSNRRTSTRARSDDESRRDDRRVRSAKRRPARADSERSHRRRRERSSGADYISVTTGGAD